ncbi:MAG TPA: hypothetical protein VMY87_00150 [Armatimonadota bacterium]|nr:hypothetical protein [Armatimonadota bacterium]
MTIHRLALRSGEHGFFTLIGLLLALVIIVILLSMYGLPGGTGGSTPGGDPVTVLGGTKDRAQGAVCRNNLSQLRAAIGIQAGTTGANPPSLDSLHAGVDLVCPGSGDPYQYDPTTGKVSCVHPGHESF